MNITRYADSQHSWFKVPRSLIKKLELEDKISSCSYQLNNFVYLEEDCDAATLFKALLKTDNISWELISQHIKVTTKHTNRSSRVRTYPKFIPNFTRPEWTDGQEVTLYGHTYTMKSSHGQKYLYSNGTSYRFKSSDLDQMFIKKA